MTSRTHAKELLAAGRIDEAIELLLHGFVEAAIDGGLEARLELLCEAFRARDIPRAVAQIELFRGRLTEAETSSTGQHADLARAARARRDSATAGRLYERAGMLGHAAVQLEAAGEDRAARLLWSQLAADHRLDGAPYVRGLVRYNESQAAARLGDATAARRAVVESVGLLEAAADAFEASGRRERAFDCYQALTAIGRATGTYENLAEGYLNCIRIAKEDELSYVALQLYEDLQALSIDHGELLAAATLFEEAADYCRARGLPYARFHRERAAETRAELATRALELAPNAEAERAATRAVEALLGVGAYARARALYQRLGVAARTPDRKARFARFAGRLDGLVDTAMDAKPLPGHLRAEGAYPEVWRIDLLEWEQRGDPAESMAELLAAPGYPSHTRHRALLCRLEALWAEAQPDLLDRWVRLASHLADLGVYGALAPLETLSRHAAPSVRAAAIGATRRLAFKRSFELVERGLADEASEVREAALDAIEGLGFAHALDPLRRLYERHRDANTRRALLAAIARIPRREATLTLLEVLRGGDADERLLAGRALARSADPEASQLLDQEIAASEGPLRQRLEELRASRP